MLGQAREEFLAGLLAGVGLEHRRGVAGDYDGALAVAADLAGGVDERLGEEDGRTGGCDDLMDEGAVFVGAGDDVFQRESDLVAARDDDRPAVVGPELGEVREGLYEIAVEQPVAGVGAVGRTGAEVEVEFRFGIRVGVRVAGVDDGLGLGEAHDSADDLLRHADEAGVGHVGENGRIGLEDMGEVHVGRRVAGHTAVSDYRAGRVAGRFELALEVLEDVEHRRSLFVGQRVLDHDVPVDFEVVALGGREGGERSFEGVGGVGGHGATFTRP